MATLEKARAILDALGLPPAQQTAIAGCRAARVYVSALPVCTLP